MNSPEPSFLDPILAAAGARKIEGAPVASVPPGYKLESLRKYDDPQAATGTVAVHSLNSLAEYLKKHSDAASAIFAGREDRIVFGVVDWHDKDPVAGEIPGWARHRVDYKLRFTPEWEAWTGISGRAIQQAAFAEFIEENLPDIIAPDSATVLEVVSKLTGTRKIEFGSARNLGNGDVAIMWQETTDAGSGVNQETKVPSELTLRLPVFVGAEKATTFDVKAFLRYRIKDGSLTFEVKLHRPEKAIDAAFDEVVSELRSALATAEVTDVPLYLGTVTKWPSEILA